MLQPKLQHLLLSTLLLINSSTFAMDLVPAKEQAAHISLAEHGDLSLHQWFAQLPPDQQRGIKRRFHEVITLVAPHVSLTPEPGGVCCLPIQKEL